MNNNTVFKMLVSFLAGVALTIMVMSFKSNTPCCGMETSCTSSGCGVVPTEVHHHHAHDH